MNALLLISVVPLGVLGAVLIAQGAIGWGISLWLVAVVLSQATFVADVGLSTGAKRPRAYRYFPRLSPAPGAPPKARQP